MITCQVHAAKLAKIWSSAYFVFNYLDKRQDDNESNSCKLVVDWLIVLMLLFTGDE